VATSIKQYKQRHTLGTGSTSSKQCWTTHTVKVVKHVVKM